MCFYQKSIAESIGENMAYYWSSFIGIGIANTFFHEVYVLIWTILFKSIVNNPDFYTKCPLSFNTGILC